MNLTLVLDESGSMTGMPMTLQMETCRVIAGSLRSGGVVSMVGWDTPALPGDPDLAEMRTVLEAL